MVGNPDITLIFGFNVFAVAGADGAEEGSARGSYDRDCEMNSEAIGNRRPLTRTMLNAHFTFRCSGGLWRNRRSGPQDDLSRALCNGETRQPERSRDRGRVSEMVSRAFAEAGDTQHQAIGRDR